MLLEKRRRFDPDDTLKSFLAIIVSIHKQWDKLKLDYLDCIRNILDRMVSLANEKLHEVSEELKPTCSELKNLFSRDITALNEQNIRHCLQNFLEKFSPPAPYDTGISIRMSMNIPHKIRRVIEPVIGFLLEGALVSGINDIDTYINCKDIKYDIEKYGNKINPKMVRDAQKLEYILRFNSEVSRQLAKNFGVEEEALLNFLSRQIRDFTEIAKYSKSEELDELEEYQKLGRLLKLLQNRLLDIFGSSDLMNFMSGCKPRQHNVVWSNFKWIDASERGQYKLRTEEDKEHKEFKEFKGDLFQYFQSKARRYKEKKIQERMLVLEDINSQRFQIISKIAYILKKYREEIKNILGRDARIKFRGSLVRGLKGYPKQGILPNFSDYDCDAFIEVPDRWWAALQRLRPAVEIEDPNVPGAFRTRRLRHYESLSGIRTGSKKFSYTRVSDAQKKDEDTFSKMLRELIIIENNIKKDLKYATENGWLSGYAVKRKKASDGEPYLFLSYRKLKTKEKNEIEQLDRIAVIYIHNTYYIGFCNSNKQYAETIVNNRDFISLLSEYNRRLGEGIFNRDDCRSLIESVEDLIISKGGRIQGEPDFDFYIRPMSSVRRTYEEGNPYLPEHIKVRGYPKLAEELKECAIREFDEDVVGCRKHSVLAAANLATAQAKGVKLPEYQIVIGCREWYLEDDNLLRWRDDLHFQRRKALPAGIDIFNPEPLQEARKRPPVGTSRERLPMYDEPLPLIRGCYPDKTEVPDKLRFLREEKGLPFIKPRRQS